MGKDFAAAIIVVNMLVTSKIHNEKFIWIKVPKTGTRAYTKVFHPDGEKLFIGEQEFYHVHKPFSLLYHHHQKKYNGFTVVRNPRTRFISALKHLAEMNYECKEENCVNHPGNLPLHDLDKLITFLYDNFEKNCLPKNNKSFKQIFGVEFTGYHESFFKTQTFWAYHPKLKIFKYENIENFNYWIENTLGYATSKLQRIGEVKINHLAHLDFDDKHFKKVVHHLFYDDYQMFNYQEDV